MTEWKGLDPARKPIFLSYDRAELMLAALLDRAAAWQPDLVVGVMRGGIVPASMAASLLALDLAFVGYDRATRTVSAPELAGRRLLIVDDGASSGGTLHDVRQALSRPGRACLTLALVHDPDRAEHIPDLSHPMRALWRFPWERGEATPAGRRRRAGGAGPDKATELSFTALDLEGALATGFRPAETGAERAVALAARPDDARALLQRLGYTGMQLACAPAEAAADPAALAQFKADTATRLGCTHAVEGDAEQALLIAALAPHLLVSWWSAAAGRCYAVAAVAGAG